MIFQHYLEEKLDDLEKRIEALEQEPCEDAVAKERYEDLCEYLGGAKDILKNQKDFKAWLERIEWHIHKAEELYEKYERKVSLPSVQPKAKTGEWISVNDMLPSDCDCDWVLAQIQEDNGYMWIPCVAEYRKAKDDWLCEEHNVGWLKDHNGAFKVIAWMPLPAPYKAESEDKE